MIFDLKQYIIGSESSCTTSSNGTSVTEEFASFKVTCRMEYMGNLIRTMTWRQNGGPIITPGVVNSTVSNTSVTSSLTVTATRNMDGSTFSYVISFGLSDIDSNSCANNVPELLVSRGTQARWMYYVSNFFLQIFVDKFNSTSSNVYS